MLQQGDVNYVPVSPNLPDACAGCRWFNSYGSYSESAHPDCRLVESYPDPIEATGWCNRYEVMPSPEWAQSPMPVVIVDPETLTDKAAEPPKDEEDTVPAEPVADEDAESDEAQPSEAAVNVPPSIRKLVLNIGAQVQEAVEKALGVGRSTEQTAFKVVGNHFLCVWSNNFKDRDGEVFTEKAIDGYIDRVDTGRVPLPELWVWHGGKNVAIGSADWVARHGHFVMAMGQFYGSAPAQAAKAYYAKHAKDTGISHGFAYPADHKAGKQYHRFNTFEISLLPRGTEANWYTSLEGVKQMAVDGEKLDYFKQVFGEEHAARILEDWDKRGKALEELGVAYKDFTGQDLTPSAEATKQALAKADKAFADLLGEVLQTSAEPITAATEAVKAAKATDQRVDELERQVKALTEQVTQRPRASQNAATGVETSHLSPEMVKQIQEQTTEKDPFWGTTVVKTP
jgi:hypothetical protein